MFSQRTSLPLSNETPSYQVSCTQCGSPLGTSDNPDAYDAYRLRKPQLAISSAGTCPVSYPYEKWFTSHLLHCLESQGVRKFIVRRQSAQPAAVKIWVFSPSLTISSSAAETNGPHQVMKVMWQDCEPGEAESEKLNAQQLSEGDIDVPEHEFQELISALKSSGLLLPENARSFQQWRVGLLSQFVAERVRG